MDENGLSPRDDLCHWRQAPTKVFKDFKLNLDLARYDMTREKNGADGARRVDKNAAS